MSFTADQPKDGDCVLTCGHNTEPYHFSKAPGNGELPFMRPDGTKGLAQWLVECNTCFTERSGSMNYQMRTDGRWLGDEPVVEEP